MRLQFSLTVNEAKVIIAKGIKARPDVKQAFSCGKILLKAGTTVSALSEELVGMPLGICGRITPRGATGPRHDLDVPHCLLVDKGRIVDVDSPEGFEKAALSLGRSDVLVTGANAFDVDGNAAMMAGSPLGGFPGKILPAVVAEGVQVIIAVGLEKLIPGKLRDAVSAAGRRCIDASFGMAVGLIPISGQVVHEKKAVELLAGVKATVIGMGGICGAEGGTTLVAQGPSVEVCKLLEIVEAVKGADVSGAPRSLVECAVGCDGCAEHLGCIYRKKGTT